MTAAKFFVLLPLLAYSVSGALVKRQVAGTAVVDLGEQRGETRFLASGFLYGFPGNGSDASTAIPDHFLTDIKFNVNRGGGAQIPPVGWATGGYEGYRGRFESTLSNYRTTRKYGGSFLLMPSDLWGSQGGAPVEFPHPGDNGDWSEMERFLRQIIADIKAYDMLPGLVVDLWNEPDLEIFWIRPWSQYVEYFVRATKLFRQELPEVLISGPSSAHSPHVENAMWREWMQTLSANGVAPDIYSWHQIGAWEREPDTTIPDFEALRREYELPEGSIDVNEYAWPDEQNPANSVFYISQFERHDIRALRANWGGGPNLHDYMASLIYKREDGTYFPNGEWQLYKYYGGMEGRRVATTASENLLFDVFAVVDDANRKLKIIAGTRTVQQAYGIRIKGLGEVGLASQGTVDVHRYQYDWAGPQTEIYGAVDMGSHGYSVANDEVTIYYDPPTNASAMAFEISF